MGASCNVRPKRIVTKLTPSQIGSTGLLKEFDHLYTHTHIHRHTHKQQQALALRPVPIYVSLQVRSLQFCRIAHNRCCKLWTWGARRDAICCNAMWRIMYIVNRPLFKSPIH